LGAARPDSPSCTCRTSRLTAVTSSLEILSRLASQALVFPTQEQPSPTGGSFIIDPLLFVQPTALDEIEILFRQQALQLNPLAVELERRKAGLLERISEAKAKSDGHKRELATVEQQVRMLEGSQRRRLGAAACTSC
jgi:hypothetical protein